MTNNNLGLFYETKPLKTWSDPYYYYINVYKFYLYAEVERFT